jgi:hypothetical protein
LNNEINLIKRRTAMTNGVSGVGVNPGSRIFPNNVPESTPTWEKSSLNVTGTSSISPGVNTLNGTVAGTVKKTDKKTDAGGASNGLSFEKVFSFLAGIFGGVGPTSIASLLNLFAPEPKVNKNEEKKKTQEP